MKLAGMKDMAKTTQMETSTSTEEAILGAEAHELLRAELHSTDGTKIHRAGSSHFGMRVAGSFGRERFHKSPVR